MKGISIAAFFASVVAAVSQDEPDLGLPQIQVPPPEPAPASGYFIQDGIVYALIGEEAVPLDREITMRVTPRAIVGFDGRRLQLPEGQMLTLEGDYVPVPTVTARTEAVAATTGDGKSTVTTTTTTVTEADVKAKDAEVVEAVPLVRLPIHSVATDPLPPVRAPEPGLLPTAQSPLSPATIPPPQPPFAAPGRPDRTGPLTDSERAVDRTRPESTPSRNNDVTRLRDEQRPMDRTRPGTDDTKYRDRTMPGTDDWRYRDRTMQGPDDERPLDITRRPPRN